MQIHSEILQQFRISVKSRRLSHKFKNKHVLKVTEVAKALEIMRHILCAFISFSSRSIIFNLTKMYSHMSEKAFNTLHMKRLSLR
jgi:hypothetical protein